MEEANAVAALRKHPVRECYCIVEEQENFE
jgi:hypothetical protein